MAQEVAAASDELASALQLEWYHTIELEPGVITPGWFDTRAIVGRLPFPTSLKDKRCLDVATFDGFWAFEMERRGAEDVYAIDVLDPYAWDWPATAEEETLDALNRRKDSGRGLTVAHRLLDSRVQFEERSVYELDPGEIGEFDFVYVGSLLMHLRDPVRALERVRSVCRGTLLLVDNIDLWLTLVFPRRAVATFDGMGRPWWWKANTAGLLRMLRAAGFEVVSSPMRFYMPPGAGHPSRRSIRPGMLRTREGRQIAITALKGDPHAAVLARPITQA